MMHGIKHEFFMHRHKTARQDIYRNLLWGAYLENLLFRFLSVGSVGLQNVLEKNHRKETKSHKAAFITRHTNTLELLFLIG